MYSREYVTFEPVKVNHVFHGVFIYNKCYGCKGDTSYEYGAFPTQQGHTDDSSYLASKKVNKLHSGASTPAKDNAACKDTNRAGKITFIHVRGKGKDTTFTDAMTSGVSHFNDLKFEIHSKGCPVLLHNNVLITRLYAQKINELLKPTTDGDSKVKPAKVAISNESNKSVVTSDHITKAINSVNAEANQHFGVKLANIAKTTIDQINKKWSDKTKSTLTAITAWANTCKSVVKSYFEFENSLL